MDPAVTEFLTSIQQFNAITGSGGGGIDLLTLGVVGAVVLGLGAWVKSQVSDGISRDNTAEEIRDLKRRIGGGA